MSGERAGDAELAHAFDLLKSTEAIADTLDRARHYGQRAIDALGSFAPSAARAAMIETAEFAVARAYLPRFRSKPPFPICSRRLTLPTSDKHTSAHKVTTRLLLHVSRS